MEQWWSKLVVVLGLVGCAGNDPSPWHVDVAFTADERAQIVEAHDFIEARTGAEHRELVFDLPHLAEGIEPTATWSVVRREGVGGHCDCTDGVLDVGVGEVGPNGVDFPTLVAHEFGHSLGLTHHTGPGIMNPIVSGPFVWTPEDQVGCVSNGVCR
jgi:Matrixin